MKSMIFTVITTMNPYSFHEKESCFAGFSACGGSLCDRFHTRRSAIKALSLSLDKWACQCDTTLNNTIAQPASGNRAAAA